MPMTTVRSGLAIGGQRLHRFQIVRERRPDGGHEDWIIVDFIPDGVELASPDFEWTRTVPTRAFEDGSFDPQTAGGVPIWGY